MAVDGNRIRQLRKRIGLTQEALGKKLGVIKQTVSSWENNISEPNSEVLSNMASIFDVSIGYLYGLTDECCSAANMEWRYSLVSNRLGNILNQYRKDNRLSEQDFSKMLNISTELYAGIEFGKYIPSYELLKKASEVTGYDINYMTGATDHTSVPSHETFKLGGKQIPMLYSESNHHFKARFEDLCLRKGINQTNAEQYLGLSKQDFFDICWNRMPTLSELLKISYAFGESMDYLIGKTDLKLSGLTDDELELILNYRDCLPRYKENISKRARDLSIQSVQEYESTSVAADNSLKRTGTTNSAK